MKIILAACPTIEPDILKLSLGYLKAYAKQFGFNVHCFDFDNTFSDAYNPSACYKIADMLLEQKPDIIGFTIYRHSLSSTQNIV